MPPARLLRGWGGTSGVRASGHAPATRDAAMRALAASPALPRGLGRSYGDAALPAEGTPCLDARGLDRFVSFDAATGVLVAEGGIPLHAILETFVPRGWFLPVTPGTRFVTLGGAVASNVHGKNHHHRGSIERFIEWIEVATPSGLLRCGPTERADLFRAAVGGYGLTGLVTQVALRLKPVASPWIRTRAMRRPDLNGLFEAFRAEDDGCEYSVAWVDTLARGRALGRGVLLLGDHDADPDAPSASARAFRAGRSRVNVPYTPPSGLLHPFALRAFNALYYHLPRPDRETRSGYAGYFYPLDAIGNWNRLYGPRGFYQYQFVIPDAPDGSTRPAEEGVRECLAYLARHGMGSFLAVLKRCGDDGVLLPFCRRGFTLALDIPARGIETLRRLEDLDRLVLGYGGRVYLTKDARLPRDTFREMYPEWKAWMDVVRRYNPEGTGRSRMSERLGLWDA